MRNSTAVRCPPIVMSSPCTVATTSSPLMRPLHSASSGPVPLVTSLVSASCALLVAVLGRVSDADDPPYETEGRCRFLLYVQCNLLLGFRLGMTGGTGPLQYLLTSGSLAACLSASVRLILSSAAASRAGPCAGEIQTMQSIGTSLGLEVKQVRAGAYIRIGWKIVHPSQSAAGYRGITWCWNCAAWTSRSLCR